MRIEQVVDHDAGTVERRFVLPLAVDPDRAADIAWELTQQAVTAAQADRQPGP